MTGTSKGIGKALAEGLLHQGNTWVNGVARGAAKLQHPCYQHISVDLAHFSDIWDKLDLIFTLPNGTPPEKLVLVNNAATLGEIAYVGEASAAVFPYSVNLNIGAPMLLCHEFLRRFAHLPSQKIIINLSSGAAQKPYDGWAAYCASKAAIDMFSRCLALEQQQRQTGVRVFAVAPGVVDTAMQAQIRTAAPREFAQWQRFEQLHQQGQLYTPDEAARRIMRLIAQPEAFGKVVLDVRQMPA